MGLSLFALAAAFTLCAEGPRTNCVVDGDTFWMNGVKVRLADVRQAAADSAPLAFQAEQNVLLDLVELTDSGWARVAHRDGQGGYIRINQVWGL